MEIGKESLQTPSQNLMGKKMYMLFLMYVYSKKRQRLLILTDLYLTTAWT